MTEVFNASVTLMREEYARPSVIVNQHHIIYDKILVLQLVG